MIDTLQTWALLARMRRNVRGTPDGLVALQDLRLREAVVHAWGNVPFYRRVWEEAGFDAPAFRGIADLERIPIVSPTDVRAAARGGELLARDIDPEQCTFLDSSGSSGRPLRVLKGPFEERLRRAGGLRIFFEHGFRWTDRSAQIQSVSGPAHLLQRLGIGRKRWISADSPIADQAREFAEARPTVVLATATRLRRLCEGLEAEGRAVEPARLVFSAGEVVDRETRATVERVLGTSPIGIYGQTEFGYVAWQCRERAAYHLNADTHLVEVRDGDDRAKPGEVGRIVTTDLSARTMPFLRVDTGDLARAGDRCPCGRTLPVLASLEGRETGAVTLPGGRIVTTSAIVDQLIGVLPLDQYRLHQESLTRFRLQRPAAAAGGHEAASSRLGELLGPVKILEDVLAPWPEPQSGKTLTVTKAV